MKIRLPAGALPEEGVLAFDGTGRDAHMSIVENGWEYDLWQVYKPPPHGGGTLEFSWGGRAWLDGDGRAEEQLDPSRGPVVVGHATAAHFASLAGRIRVEELQSGEINHALFIVIDCGSASSVYPARNHDKVCANQHDAPPMGSRFQLNMTEAQISALPILEWKKIILRAMAKYGMFFGDTGSKGLFAIETESSVQYTSQAVTDKWLEFAQQNQWERFDPDGTGPRPEVYVGKLYDNNINWMSDIWSKLRVIDPCVSERTC